VLWGFTRKSQVQKYWTNFTRKPLTKQRPFSTFCSSGRCQSTLEVRHVIWRNENRLLHSQRERERTSIHQNDRFYTSSELGKNYMHYVVSFKYNNPKLSHHIISYMFTTSWHESILLN
jgi:hypothetical protein